VHSTTQGEEPQKQKDERGKHANGGVAVAAQQGIGETRGAGILTCTLLWERRGAEVKYAKEGLKSIS